MPSVLLDSWDRDLGPELLPVQERAVAAGVLDGRSVVVSSPTSSGKTFVGEMAAAQAALSGRRVVYLVPTKALAEAKYRQFADCEGIHRSPPAFAAHRLVALLCDFLESAYGKRSLGSSGRGADFCRRSSRSAGES